ncbi:MAG: hypothetical protein LV481_07600 [Methylacidiphilales bacterium]|nr:hypothetical protein [Candidatus Methylacidiphilales bacterium]
MGALKLNLNGKEFSSELSKLTRADIYGDSKTRVLGPDDEVLSKAGVSENGRDYLTRGDFKYALAIGDEFTLKPTQVVNALDGKPVEQIPSSFAVAPKFELASADEVAQLEVDVVYRLEGVQVEAGSRFIGTFNYRAGYEKKDAVIIGKSEGAFLLVGTLKKASFVGMDVDSQLIAAEETAEEVSGDGDFGSLYT